MWAPKQKSPTLHPWLTLAFEVQFTLVYITTKYFSLKYLICNKTIFKPNKLEIVETDTVGVCVCVCLGWGLFNAYLSMHVRKREAVVFTTETWMCKSKEAAVSVSCCTAQLKGMFEQPTTAGNNTSSSTSLGKGPKTSS